jgi:hypothetical protein
MDACVWFVQVPARGAWMFAEMLINFCFGKLLHYPYVLFIGKVMPNFSGDMTINYSKYSHLLHTVRAGNDGAPHERRYGG